MLGIASPVGAAAGQFSVAAAASACRRPSWKSRSRPTRRQCAMDHRRGKNFRITDVPFR